MKFCFFLQRNFSAIGDALAVTLRDKHGITDFCGFVQARWALTYLKTKSDIPWQELLLDEDVHATYKNEKLDLDYLRALEARIGMPNLWPYLTADRVLMQGQLVREYPHNKPMKNHEELLRIMQTTAKHIEAFLDRQKLDVAVFSVIGGLSALLLYHLAKKRGIRTLFIFPALFESRFLLTERHDYYEPKEDIGDAFSSPPTKDAEVAAAKFLKEFREAPRPYYHLASPDKQQVSRAAQLRFLLPLRLWKTSLGLYRAFQNYHGSGIKDDYSTTATWQYIADAAKRKLRNLRGVADLYDVPEEGEKFAFFPLQYEPEVTLLVQAPYMADQIAVARTLARALPVGWKLYVKEHPQMVEFRPRRYYEELKKIPNLRLIDPATKSFALIQKCDLVTTITGTVGFEACLLGKPVVTLGNNYFNTLSSVKYVSALNNVADAIKEQVAHFAFDEKELVHLLAKIIDESVAVPLQDAWYYESDRKKKIAAMVPLADLIARKVGASKRERQNELDR